LVVDDESPLRVTICRDLVNEGYHVLEAGNGVEALEVLQHTENEVDLVITDIRMPRMDGYELADRLTERRNRVPMIFISGLEQTGISLPGSIFLKPFSMGKLLAEIRRLLDDNIVEREISA
jgi:two-component system cell cycle sensor histidine kinase/response regulator CckA